MIIKEVEHRDSSLGRVLYIKMYEPGYPVLAWSDVWKAFSERYPGQWAVQCFPPSEELVDGKPVYHLFVCEQVPVGLNIRG